MKIVYIKVVSVRDLMLKDEVKHTKKHLQDISRSLLRQTIITQADYKQIYTTIAVLDKAMVKRKELQAPIIGFDELIESLQQ